MPAPTPYTALLNFRSLSIWQFCKAYVDPVHVSDEVTLK